MIAHWRRTWTEGSSASRLTTSMVSSLSCCASRKAVVRISGSASATAVWTYRGPSIRPSNHSARARARGSGLAANTLCSAGSAAAPRSLSAVHPRYRTDWHGLSNASIAPSIDVTSVTGMRYECPLGATRNNRPRSISPCRCPPTPGSYQSVTNRLPSGATATSAGRNHWSRVPVSTFSTVAVQPAPCRVTG